MLASHILQCREDHQNDRRPLPILTQTLRRNVGRRGADGEIESPQVVCDGNARERRGVLVSRDGKVLVLQGPAQFVVRNSMQLSEGVA